MYFHYIFMIFHVWGTEAMLLCYYPAPNRHPAPNRQRYLKDSFTPVHYCTVCPAFGSQSKVGVVRK